MCPANWIIFPIILAIYPSSRVMFLVHICQCGPYLWGPISKWKYDECRKAEIVGLSLTCGSPAPDAPTPIRSAPDPVTLPLNFSHLQFNHIPRKYRLQHFCLLIVAFFHLLPHFSTRCSLARCLPYSTSSRFTPRDSFPISALPYVVPSKPYNT